MKNLVLTDDLAYRLHTMYEHFDEHKHHFDNEIDLEVLAELGAELVKEYHSQENND